LWISFPAVAKKGIDVNAQGGKYGDVLQAASYRGHDQIVQRLLEEGADRDESTATRCRQLHIYLTANTSSSGCHQRSSRGIGMTE
jgi:hypothetical protein